MGAGDWIMATAQVRELNERYKLPVVVYGPNGRRMWHEVFENNPRILRTPSTRFVRLVNGPGERPYIARKRTDRWTWQRWAIAPGEIYLTAREHEWAADALREARAAASLPWLQALGTAAHAPVLVEPNTKGTNEGNKAWLWDRWQALVLREPYGTFVQAGPPGVQRLAGVLHVQTPTFRHACALLAQCRAVVTTEGGLHHAAAALQVPAVVLWSEFIEPAITGYGTQCNLRHAGPACGMRTACEGCRASMRAIEVDEVDHHIKELLQSGNLHATEDHRVPATERG